MYSLENAFASKLINHVVVTSDDDELLALASKENVFTLRRDPSLSSDEITLECVIYDAFVKSLEHFGKTFTHVVTMQPTSPLLKHDSIDKAISLCIDRSLDTVISVTDDSHLSWKKENGRIVKNYEQRLNRQYLPSHYKETGGFVICTGDQIKNQKTRFGDIIDIFELTKYEAFDIDDQIDWSNCEYALNKKNLLIRVSGHPAIGYGHIVNCLAIANSFPTADICFLLDDLSKDASKLIQSHSTLR